MLSILGGVLLGVAGILVIGILMEMIRHPGEEMLPENVSEVSLGLAIAGLLLVGIGEWMR